MTPHLFTRLDQFGALPVEARKALAGVIMRPGSFVRGEDLVVEGAAPSHCIVVVEGLICRYRLIEGGRRQIVSFHVPGDFCDLHGLWLDMDHSVCAITAGKAVLIPHEALRGLIAAHPALGAALWRMTLTDGAVYREWMVGMGRRSALTRVAHLLCEMHEKLRTVGQATDDAFALPLTQGDLADALGLSVVHVNRVLQQLRSTGAVTMRGAQVRIHDRDQLCAVGEFEPGYLHLHDSRVRAERRAGRA